MQSAILERVCPYCGSNKLTFLEHGVGGTLFQCELCARATVQRWETEAEAVQKTIDAETLACSSCNKGTAGARQEPK